MAQFVSYASKGEYSSKSSVDLNAQLISASVGKTAVGIGWANESGFYTEHDCDQTKVIDKTEKVLGVNRDAGGWDSSSPYTLGAEVGVLVSAGIQVDFGKIWNSLWK